MKKIYKNAFVRQLDHTDCGVACLATIAKYYGGELMHERMRELSGTDRQGTTMLGLLQAARQVGFEGDGFEAEIPDLKEQDTPCILHVVKDEILNHYVVCYGFEEGKFIISDPATEVSLMEEDELAEIWKTKTLLLVKPTEDFKKTRTIWYEKWYWIKALIKDDVNLLAIALVIGVIISILSMSTAVFSQKLIDNILPSGDSFKLAVGLAILFSLLIVKSGVGFIRSFFLLRQKKDFNNRILNYFYGTLMFLPKMFFDNRKVGELVARMNDTSRIQGSLSYLISDLTIDILMVLVSSVFILIYSPKLGLLALLSIPMYFLIAFVYHKPILTKQREVMQAYARNESNYVDTMQGVGDIKAGNKEPVFANLTKEIYGFLQDKAFSLGKLGIHIGIVGGIAGTVLMMVIISLGTFMVLKNEMKLGELMAVMQMIGMLMPAAGQLAMLNLQLQEARVAFDRMYEFTSLEPEYQSDEDAGKPVLETFNDLKVEHMTFRFPGRSPLIKDFSFSVKKGEMICLLGESGCGKSTTLQILQKFYKHEEGELFINGQPWDHFSTKSWRDIISVVPQEIKIFNGSLMSNVCLGENPQTEEGLQKIFHFFHEYGFDKYFQKFPQGYLTILGEEGVNISGGQQQLVALARALYKKPQLLLLDEATSAMDRNTESFIIDLLHKLKNDIGIILVTHRVKTARKADHIYVIEEGYIKAHGKHAELMKGDNLYATSWKDYLDP